MTAPRFEVDSFSQPMHTAPLPVSVVVPTFRRPRLLARCLEALLRQDLDGYHYEIVVVDDGPDAETEEVVKICAAFGGGRPAVRYVPATATQGPAAARNCGWRVARGCVIAFTDDDTIPSRCWLREGLAAMGPGVDAAAGRMRMPLKKTPSDYERNAAALSTAEFATANCFVRRQALEAIDGFDERFTEAWREDSDLQFMLLRRGGVIAGAPAAVVRRPIRPGGLLESLRYQHKVFFDALLFKKHPALYRSRIRQWPRWDYYLTVVSLIMFVAGAAANLDAMAAAAAALWGLLTVSLCARRLHGTSRSALQMLDVVATSMLIPLISTYWRIAGALRFRTLFF